MVHGFALLPELLDALQDPDMDFAVRKVDSEIAPLGIPVLLFMSNRFPYAFLLSLLAVILPFQFHLAVVFRFEVGGAHIFGIA